MDWTGRRQLLAKIEYVLKDCRNFDKFSVYYPARTYTLIDEALAAFVRSGRLSSSNYPDLLNVFSTTYINLRSTTWRNSGEGDPYKNSDIHKLFESRGFRGLPAELVADVFETFSKFEPDRALMALAKLQLLLDSPDFQKLNVLLQRLTMGLFASKAAYSVDSLDVKDFIKDPRFGNLSLEGKAEILKNAAWSFNSSLQSHLDNFYWDHRRRYSSEAATAA